MLRAGHLINGYESKINEVVHVDEKSSILVTEIKVLQNNL